VSGERVVSAAVRVNGRVYTGASHKVAVHVAARVLNVLPQVVWAALVEGGAHVGFTTSRGRFVSRAEAYRVAVAAGQVEPDQRGELHSEDLVRGPS
jgi:hypothetical protein